MDELLDVILNEELDLTDVINIDEAIGGVAPVKTGKKWLVTIAKPGTGQMGIYPESTLKTFGAAAFPAGTKSFFTHEKRDPRDQVGTFEEGAFWNEEEGELQGVLTPFPRYVKVLNEAKKQVEASMHVASRKDRTTNIVKELVYHRGNTVDLVGFGGLEGSGLKFQLESLFAAAAEEIEEEEENMEITKEMWDSLVASQSTLADKFDTFASESLADKQGVADEAAVTAAVETKVGEALDAYDAKATAIDAATIPAVQKEALKARARKGEDVTNDLAAAVSFVAEALKEFAPSTKIDEHGKVVVVSESLAEDFNPSIGRW